jgi:hypothetical protein
LEKRMTRAAIDAENTNEHIAAHIDIGKPRRRRVRFAARRQFVGTAIGAGAAGLIVGGLFAAAVGATTGIPATTASVLHPRISVDAPRRPEPPQQPPGSTEPTPPPPDQPSGSPTPPPPKLPQPNHHTMP